MEQNIKTEESNGEKQENNIRRLHAWNFIYNEKLNFVGKGQECEKQYKQFSGKLSGENLQCVKREACSTCGIGHGKYLKKNLKIINGLTQEIISRYNPKMSLCGLSIADDEGLATNSLELKLTSLSPKQNPVKPFFWNGRELSMELQHYNWQFVVLQSTSILLLYQNTGLWGIHSPPHLPPL